MDRYRIILADDHILVREGLKKLLEKDADLEVVGEASDGQALLDLVPRMKPDLVITDISMPRLSGIEVIREIKRAFPGVNTLILTMHDAMEYLHQAICVKADGYLLKEDAPQELFSAIRTIRLGRFYTSSILSKNLTEKLLLFLRSKTPGSHSLTPRERQVLNLVAGGKSNKEIGHSLFISARTVETHRSNIKNKLSLKDTAGIVRFAIEKSLV